MKAIVLVLALGGCVIQTSQPAQPQYAGGAPGQAAAAGTEACPQVAECYSHCTPGIGGQCLDECDTHAKPGTQPIARAAYDCVLRSGCQDQACAEQACPNEIQACSADQPAAAPPAAGSP